jgi:NADPH2:quinone reductase
MAIKQAYAVEPGNVLVVSGGAGAIGSIITRWAVALGATVIAVVGSSSKVEAALANGAADVLVGTTDLQRIVFGYTNDLGADAVLDAVGGDGVNQFIPVVKHGGSIVSYGNAAGQANPNPVLLARRSVAFGSPSLGQYLEGKAATQEAVDELFSVAESGIFDTLPVIQVSLRDVRTAHRDLEERRTTGITVLTPLSTTH